jgi:hypothetical protein
LIRERVFKFSVFSHAVGFMVYNLRSYACSSFQCYFHLWGFGEPNWQREFDLWSLEEQAIRTSVSRRKSPLTGANVVPVAADRSFADVASHSNLDPRSSDQVANAGHAPARLNFSNPSTGCNLFWRPIRPEPPQVFTPVICCSRCLASGHNVSDCTSEIRCKSCYQYGHIKWSCLLARRKKHIFCIKEVSPGNQSRSGSPAVPTPNSSSCATPSTPPPTSPTRCPSTMATYPH